MSSPPKPTQQQSPDYQKWIQELTRRDAERQHDHMRDSMDSLLKSAMDSAQMALRTSVLINGGAAVSVLAFIGGLVANGRLKTAEIATVALTLLWFATGAATATVAIALAYLANYSYANALNFVRKTWTHPYSTDTEASRRWNRVAMMFHVFAIVVAAASLALFVFGMVAVKNAISVLP
jgi:hypothetical protein